MRQLILNTLQVNKQFWNKEKGYYQAQPNLEICQVGANALSIIFQIPNQEVTMTILIFILITMLIL